MQKEGKLEKVVGHKRKKKEEKKREGKKKKKKKKKKKQHVNLKTKKPQLQRGNWSEEKKGGGLPSGRGTVTRVIAVKL